MLGQSIKAQNITQGMQNGDWANAFVIYIRKTHFYDISGILNTNTCTITPV
jgi:hypothetical protein